MRKSWLVARALPRALVLLLVAAALVWLPASGSAGRARVSTLNIDPIHADFDGDLRQTTYSVPNVSDPNATYQWTLDITDPAGRVDPTKPLDPDCNNHGVLAGTDKTFIWHHGNSGDKTGHDDGCNHDVYGLWGHQGLITVTVSDSAGDHCTATYKGTYSTDENAALGLDAASERVCTQAPPPPPPPPPPPKRPLGCKCIRLTVGIVPSSIHLEDHYGAIDDYTYLTFSLRWRFKCTKGSAGRCSSEFTVSVPKEGDLQKVLEHIYQHCLGRCGRLNVGRTKEIYLHYDKFTPIERARIGRVPIVIQPYCAGKNPPIQLSIAFNDNGSVDLKKSKLG